jgi:hypothetical protein
MMKHATADSESLRDNTQRPAWEAELLGLALDPTGNYCMHRNYYDCTRTKGHTGPHAGHGGDGTLYATWPNTSDSSTQSTLEIPVNQPNSPITTEPLQSKKDRAIALSDSIIADAAARYGVDPDKLGRALMDLKQDGFEVGPTSAPVLQRSVDLGLACLAVCNDPRNPEMTALANEVYDDLMKDVIQSLDLSAMLKELGDGSTTIKH